MPIIETGIDAMIDCDGLVLQSLPIRLGCTWKAVGHERYSARAPTDSMRGCFDRDGGHGQPAAGSGARAHECEKEQAMNANNTPILVVDDDPNDVLLLQHAFRELNLANPVLMVGDGEQAIAYLAGDGVYADREQYPLPRFVLLDLKMPRKSGFEVLEWVRQQPGLKHLPVVTLTSSREISDINRAYELGANSYLCKPVKFDVLLEMMKTVTQYWLVFNEYPDGAS